MSEKISQLIENDLYDADEIAIDGKPVFNFPGGEHDGYCAVNLRNAVICSKRRFNELTAEIGRYRKALEEILSAHEQYGGPYSDGEIAMERIAEEALSTKNSGPAPNPENHDIRAPMMGEGAGSLHSTKDSPEMTAGERDILHTALRGSVRKVTEKNSESS